MTEAFIEPHSGNRQDGVPMITIPPHGNRWRIVRRKADVLRWREHCPPFQPSPYVWMIEAPRWENIPIRLYLTFEDARKAFADGR